jgi:ketosteroid isomerase-like protein
MKKLIVLLLLMSSGLNVSAQDSKTEINEQIWKPFIQSFNNRDTKAFMDVHSKDVVRSPRESKVAWNWDEYFKQMERSDKSERASKSTRNLELRFTERISNKGLAVEVGIYKTTYVSENGLPKSYYGRFHVVHRKENGIWKILVDTDSSEGNSIDEKDFLEASAME